MRCRSCQSEDQTEFPSEINIHFPGLKGLDKQREILADEKLERVFGVKSVTMFEMTKLINKHLSDS